MAATKLPGSAIRKLILDYLIENTEGSSAFESTLAEITKCRTNLRNQDLIEALRELGDGINSREEIGELIKRLGKKKQDQTHEQ